MLNLDRIIAQFIDDIMSLIYPEGEEPTWKSRVLFILIFGFSLFMLSTID